jgi:hypothetical protein
MSEETVRFVDADGSKRDVRVVDLIDPRAPRADATARHIRMNACHDCDAFSGGRCSECGCFMRLKTWLADATCPRGHWGAEPSSD